MSINKNKQQYQQQPSPSGKRAFANQIAMQLGKTPIQFDTPISQPFYHFSNGEWVPASSPPTNNSNSPPPQPAEKEPRIRLTTWNIDFQVPAKWRRMEGALEYLSRLLCASSTSTASTDNKDDHSDIPSIIFLQEMVDASLIQIQEAPWIRERFFITDLSDSHWKGAYGTTTLIDKRLAVQRVFRVLFSMSNMQRDGLFVDIDVGAGGQEKTIRFCNTHLESLVSNPPRRPLQLKLLSKYMHGSGSSLDPSTTTTGNTETVALPTPHAAILAGDLNAFAPEDLTAPVDCNLHDAFLALGGKDGTEESFTWGQQVRELLRETYGCSRMDKVLFCGRVSVEEFRKIGEGEKVWVEYPKWDSDIEEDEEDSDDGENVWITDHLGLQAVLKVLDP